MRRSALVKRWVRKSAVLEAALVLLLGIAPFVFDRDNDNEEDDTLELCPAPGRFLPGALSGRARPPARDPASPSSARPLGLLSPRSPPKGVLSR